MFRSKREMTYEVAILLGAVRGFGLRAWLGDREAVEHAV